MQRNNHPTLFEGLGFLGQGFPDTFPPDETPPLDEDRVFWDSQPAELDFRDFDVQPDNGYASYATESVGGKDKEAETKGAIDSDEERLSSPGSLRGERDRLSKLTPTAPISDGSASSVAESEAGTYKETTNEDPSEPGEEEQSEPDEEDQSDPGEEEQSELDEEDPSDPEHHHRQGDQDQQASAIVPARRVNHFLLDTLTGTQLMGRQGKTKGSKSTSTKKVRTPMQSEQHQNKEPSQPPKTNECQPSGEIQENLTRRPRSLIIAPGSKLLPSQKTKASTKNASRGVVAPQPILHTDKRRLPMDPRACDMSEADSETEIRADRNVETLASIVRKAEQPQKEPMKLTVYDELDPTLDRHWFGYCLINILEDHDGGRGPKLVYGRYQRPLDKANVANLRQTFGPQLDNLERRSPQHAMIIGLSPTQVSNLANSFSPTPKDAHRVAWSNAAPQGKMVCFGGFHRTAALREHYQEAREELLKALKGELPGDRAKVRKIRSHFADVGTWLVLCLNLETLEQDEENRPAIELALSTNNLRGAKKDSPAVCLRQVMNSLHTASLVGPEAYRKVYARASHLETDSGRSLQRILGKGRTTIDALVPLYTYEIYRNSYLHPDMVLDFVESSWGFVAPFVSGGYNIIAYLTSPDTYAEDAVDAWTLSGLVSDETIDPDIDLGDELFAVARYAFDSHLLENMAYFSTGTPEWQEAFDKYVQEIEQELSRKANKDDRWFLVKEKTTEVLKQGFLSGPGGVPAVPGGVPLITPSFIVSLGATFEPLSDGIHLFSRCFVQGFGVWQKCMRGSKDANLPFVSASGGLLQVFRYFHYWDTGDWHHTTIEEMAQRVEPTTGKEAGYYSMEALHVAIRMFLQYRDLAIAPDLPDIRALLVKKDLAVSKKTTEFVYPDVEKALVTLFRAWTGTISKDRTIACKDVQARYMQEVPEDVLINAKALDPEVKYHAESVLLKAQFCAFNFLNPPTSNNAITHRRRVIQALLVDDQLRDRLTDFLERHPNLSWLINEVQDQVTQLPGLKDITLTFAPPADAPENGPSYAADLAKCKETQELNEGLEILDVAWKRWGQKVTALLGYPHHNEEEDTTNPLLDPVLRDATAILYTITKRAYTDRVHAKHDPTYKPLADETLRSTPSIRTLQAEYNRMPVDFSTSADRHAWFDEFSGYESPYSDGEDELGECEELFGVDMTGAHIPTQREAQATTRAAKRQRDEDQDCSDTPPSRKPRLAAQSSKPRNEEISVSQLSETLSPDSSYSETFDDVDFDFF